MPRRPGETRPEIVRRFISGAGDKEPPKEQPAKSEVERKECPETTQARREILINDWKLFMVLRNGEKITVRLGQAIGGFKVGEVVTIMADNRKIGDFLAKITEIKQEKRKGKKTKANFLVL